MRVLLHDGSATEVAPLFEWVLAQIDGDGRQAFLEQVLMRAGRRDLPAGNFELELDPAGGELCVAQTYVVVGWVHDPEREMGLEEARAASPRVERGDVMRRRLPVCASAAAADLARSVREGRLALQPAAGHERLAELLVSAMRLVPCRSCPTVRGNSATFDSTSFATQPGGLLLDREMLRALDPGMFVLGVGPLWPWLLPREHAYADQLANGDARAALVMQLQPLLVAAYSEDFDAVVLLRFPDQLARTHGLATGTRLLAVNTYAEPDAAADGDIRHGPASSHQWGGLRPFIGQFLSRDAATMRKRVAAIGESEWARTWTDGQRWLAEHGPRGRDGRPSRCQRPMAADPRCGRGTTG